ncbi:hypothetical protein [Chitinophaga sp.]|uniref:hypothetical protein n=1 Tax=Chitinophaga sp. TaxID=1869181 RepID=UPI0026318148|nr:hypothetical protein [uncultured Chitinophaga sp.]
MKIVILACILIFIILCTLNACSQPLHFNRNENQRKLPVKKGVAGIRQVMQLRREVLMAVGPHEIRMPKGTIVDDEYQPGKVIFPGNYACTVTLGGRAITTPKGGVIRLSDTHLVSVQVAGESARFIIGGNKFTFANAMGGEGVSFFEDGSVRCGYLAEDAEAEVAGRRIRLKRKTGINNAIWDDDGFEFGNIVFYPSGALHKGELMDATGLRAGETLRKFLPGKTEWYENGSVHTGFTAHPISGTAAGADFTIHAGQKVTLSSAGTPVIPENVVTLSSISIPAFPGVEFRQAKVRLKNGAVFIQEGSLDKVAEISFGSGDSRAIPFGPGPDGHPSISFYYETFQPVFGYAGRNFTALAGKQEWLIQAGTLMRFHKDGRLQEAVLAAPATVIITGKRYLLEKGATIKLYSNGDVSEDVIQFTNKSHNLVRPLE